MEWISTAVVSLILIVIAALIIRQLIKDKKNGKHSCGGNCGCCPRIINANNLLFKNQ